MELTKTGRNWIVGGLSFAALLAATYLWRQYYLLYHAGTKLKGAVIHNLGLSNVNFTVYIEIDNTGDLSVGVNDQKYDIYIGNIFVVSVTSKDLVHIKSNNKTLLPLRIDMTPQLLLVVGLQNIGNILSDRNKFVINVKGRLSLKAGVVSLKDFDISMTFTLQEIMDLAAQPNPTNAPLIENKPLL